MFEKVNPMHPDKIADRIAGAIVDLAYKKNNNPKKTKNKKRKNVDLLKLKYYNIVKQDFRITIQEKHKQKVSSTSHLQIIICVFQKFKLTQEYRSF